MIDLSTGTAVLLVLVAVASIVYLVIVFNGWADRRDAQRRNHR